MEPVATHGDWQMQLEGQIEAEIDFVCKACDVFLVQYVRNETIY